MGLFDVFLLALALAMDCFAVSMVSGVITRKYLMVVILRMAVLFGAFQSFMPFIGWLATNHFRIYIEFVDHWIAFGLLLFIGIKMICDSFSANTNNNFNPAFIYTQILLSLATSIDALAVGISFACLGYTNITQLIIPLIIIGTVSLVMSIIGNAIGVKFGDTIATKLKPDLFGGILLLLIGIKILISHLSE